MRKMLDTRRKVVATILPPRGSRMASRKIALATTTSVKIYMMFLHTRPVDGSSQPNIMRASVHQGGTKIRRAREKAISLALRILSTDRPLCLLRAGPKSRRPRRELSKPRQDVFTEPPYPVGIRHYTAVEDYVRDSNVDIRLEPGDQLP